MKIFFHHHGIGKNIPEAVQKTEEKLLGMKLGFETDLNVRGTTIQIIYFNGTSKHAIENLKQEEQNILERQKKLLDVFLDGSISKEAHDEKNILIENQKVMIRKQISELEYKNQRTVSTLEPTKKLFLDCVIWSKEFLTLSPEKKQNIAHEVLWNLSMKDKNIVSYQLKSPYSIIAKLPENADLRTKLRDLDSNQDTQFQKL